LGSSLSVDPNITYLFPKGTSDILDSIEVGVETVAFGVLISLIGTNISQTGQGRTNIKYSGPIGSPITLSIGAEIDHIWWFGGAARYYLFILRFTAEQ